MRGSDTYAGKYTAVYEYRPVRRNVQERANDLRSAANLKYRYGSRNVWARGYFADTVGKNEKIIANYKKNRLEEDFAREQVSLKEFADPFTGV